MPNPLAACTPDSVLEGDRRPDSGAGTGDPSPDPLTERNRATWTVGDFDRIARHMVHGAEQFIDRLEILPGERVLDVACGSGNLAVPAARAGAAVTGVDIAPNLIAGARQRAVAERLSIRFDEGNVEALPYASASFDTVVTMFGAMFSPRPALVVDELIRVTRPGGRIVMANWTPGGFVGRMLRATGAYLPPPADLPSPLLWGDQQQVNERLGGRVRRLMLTPRMFPFNFPYSPAGVVELFQAFYGPTVRAFDALGPEERAAFRRDLEALWRDANLASDQVTRVDAEYLEVLAVVR